LDIEEHHIGRLRVDQAQCIEAIGGLADNAQLGPDDGQLRLQVVEQVRLVVGDQGAGMVDGGVSFNGSTRRTVMPQG
jgi:hypothetical protein